MSTYFNDINAALTQRLTTFVDLPAKVVYENTTPADDAVAQANETWVRETWLPGFTETEPVGRDAGQTHTGIYQIDIFVPRATGRGAASLLADGLADHFKRNTNLTYNGTTVRVREVSRRPGVYDTNWWKVTLQVNYISRTNTR